MDLPEVTFTDLLQHPNETVAKLEQSRRQALRVRRRGSEEDLVLTTAARVAQDKQVVDLAIRLLRAIVSDPEMRSSNLFGILQPVFPWIRFLPAEEQTEFVRELVEVMSAGEEIGSPAPAPRTITEWRNTAQIYADPELLETLRT
ncbi:hypothetical protein ACQPXM_37310 [Kribbella sp. CA-253562]|uniref:hypothetical protein n=1 Tax=Kribbella sp. CA-253562 TaxID=3239942 RepID=UPI003D924CC4